MDRLLAMEVFCKVVEQGSFVRAAERLAMSTTAVSRHLAELEAHLNTRLLQRTTRRLHLTEAGLQFHQRAQQILEEVHDAETELLQDSRMPHGLLRLSVSIPFGAKHLAPLLERFHRRYPDLSVEVVATDRKLDLVDEGLDLALRISHQLDGNLVARRITTIRTIICAAPDYLRTHGTPATPDELSQHACLRYTGTPEPGIWRFICPDEQEQQVAIGGPLSSDNGDMLLGAALQGLGIVRQPTFLVGEAITDGRLVPLLSAYRMPTLTLSAVYPSRRFLSGKVRAMIDFLLEEWGGEVPPWDRWMTSRSVPDEQK